VQLLLIELGREKHPPKEGIPFSVRRRLGFEPLKERRPPEPCDPVHLFRRKTILLHGFRSAEPILDQRCQGPVNLRLVGGPEVVHRRIKMLLEFVARHGREAEQAQNEAGKCHDSW
jgi:hypothetical protein